MHSSEKVSASLPPLSKLFWRELHALPSKRDGGEAAERNKRDCERDLREVKMRFIPSSNCFQEFSNFISYPRIPFIIIIKTILLFKLRILSLALFILFLGEDMRFGIPHSHSSSASDESVLQYSHIFILAGCDFVRNADPHS